jgi:ABC-type sugar transport system permease subunit
LYIAPALSIIIFIFFIPIIYSFVISFLEKPSFTSEFSWAGLKNFETILNKPYFSISVLNTIFYGFGAVAIKALLGLCVALLLNRKFPGRGFLRAICVLPWAIPTFAVCVVFWFVYDYRGLANIFLRQLGFSPIGWLNMDNAMFSVILTNVWKGWPFFFLGFLTGLQAIPNELYEAADIDGASYFEKLKSITLPLLLPVILTVVMLSLVWTMADFTTIYMMTGGGPLYTTLTAPMASYKIAFLSEQNLSLASAYNLTILPIYLIIMYLLLKRLGI